MHKSPGANKAAYAVRKPSLDFEASRNPYYIRNNAFASHFASAYNYFIPDAEIFFIDSVRRYKNRLRSSALASEVNIFIGQECQHSNKHRIFIKHLESLGYDVTNIMKWIRQYLGLLAHLAYPLQLSITAGMEHMTAMLGHFSLKWRIYDQSEVPMKRLWTWHSTEELEHKHVAFDVLQTISPRNYPLRLLGFLIGGFSLQFFILYGIAMMLRQDLKHRRLNIKSLTKHFISLVRDPQVRNFVGETYLHLLYYMKPGFHPNQIEDAALIAFHLRELESFTR